LIDGQPWFVAADVCKAVGVYNPRHGAAKHLRAIDDSQRVLVKLPDVPRGAAPVVLMVSRSGLDKLLWLARHSVSEAWPVLSSISAQASFIVAKETA
jgi:prophage antirepressor-like protein